MRKKQIKSKKVRKERDRKKVRKRQKKNWGDSE